MKKSTRTTHFYYRFHSSRRRLRMPHVELLEVRLPLSTTIHVDFGLGFATDAMGNLTTTEFEETTVGAIRHVNTDVDTGPHLCKLDTENNCVIPRVDEGDTTHVLPLLVDFDGVNGTDVNDIIAFAALQDEVIAIMQDVLLPFDVNVQPANASDMAQVATTLAGTQDAYVLVVDGGIVRDLELEPFDDLGLGFGLAALQDLNAQDGNETGELAFAFAKEVVDDTLAASGLMVTDPVFIDKLTHRLAYTAVHEAFHTFTFEHVLENDGTAYGDIVVDGDLNSNPGREHRALVTRSDSWVHNVNHYLKAETILGLRNDNGGLVDYTYVTGTSAHDLISILAVGDGNAVVNVTPFADPLMTSSTAAPARTC